MSAYNAIRYLLANDATVSDIVGTRIYPVTVPDSTGPDSQYPCIVVALVSEQSQTLVGLNSPYSMTVARVQVTVFHADYPSKETLMNAVLKACKSGSEMINGVLVKLIMSDTLGPDFYDETVKVFMQPQDFKVMYSQQN